MHNTLKFLGPTLLIYLLAVHGMAQSVCSVLVRPKPQVERMQQFETSGDVSRLIQEVEILDSSDTANGTNITGERSEGNFNFSH